MVHVRVVVFEFGRFLVHVFGIFDLEIGGCY